MHLMPAAQSYLTFMALHNRAHLDVAASVNLSTERFVPVNVKRDWRPWTLGCLR